MGVGEPVEERVIARRFRLKRQIGQGGFGSVWLAADTSDGGGRDVALKLLHPRLRSNVQISERFEREARLLSGLDHPNIARAIAWGAGEEPAFLAMELVAGMALDRVMVELASHNEYFTNEQVRDLFGQLCDAVGYAHSRNVVHRDLKPANVMVSLEKGAVRIKVLDFGIARLLEESPTDRTTVGRMIGSPFYLAPEQIDSSGVDQRSDIFALGCILFELLTLKRAWLRDVHGQPISCKETNASKAPENDRTNTLERILRGPRPRPSDVRPELSTHVDGPVLRALDVDPDLRFQTTENMRLALEEAFARPVIVPEDDHTIPAPPPSFDEPSVLEATLTKVMPVGFDLEIETMPPTDGRVLPLVEPVPLDTNPGLTPVVVPRTNPPLVVERVSRTPSLGARRRAAQRRRARTVTAIEIALVAMSIVLAVAVWSLHQRRAAPEPVVQAELPASAAAPALQPPPQAVRAAAIAPAPAAEVQTATAATAEPAPEPASPPRKAPPERARPRTAPQPAAPAKIEERASSRVRLIALLERARANPEDRHLVEQVTQRLETESAGLAEAERSAIKRCIVRSSMAGNLDQLVDILTGCVKQLERALEAQP